jgi:hypothetical protein
MEIPKIKTGFKALMVAGALQDEGAMGLATTALVAGIGKKIFGGFFKKKEDTLEKKFEKVLDERRSLFEKVSAEDSPESSILGKMKLVIKKMKDGLSKFLTAALAALKTIFTIVKTALIAISKTLLSLVKWIGIVLTGLLASIMKLCKTGGFRKMKTRIKVFGRTLKRFVKKPAALLIGGIALGMAGYFSAIFKKEKEEIDEIGGEKDTSSAYDYLQPLEQIPEKSKHAEEEDKGDPTKTETAQTPIPGQVRVESGGGLTTSEGTPVMTGEPIPASQAAPPRAAGAPVPASVSGSTVENKPTPMAKGDVSDSNAVELATSKLGISKEEWSIFKNTVAAIESGGAYDIAGGSGKHYDGRYQLGRDAKIDGAKVAGIANPGHGDVDSSQRIKFRKDPALQEVLFAGYTIANYNYLRSLPEFKNKSKAGQLQALGYAHNQGMGGAANWLKTGVVGSDGFGTKGTKYTDALRQNFIAAGFIGSSSSEKIQTASTPTSGNALASAGATQYDKNKETKVNVIVSSKTNIKTNNIEEPRKAA